MAKIHKWIAFPQGDEIHYQYTGSGATFTAPNPERVSAQQIAEFLMEEEGIGFDEIVKLALRYWIDAKKRTIASGGEFASEARKLRDMARMLRKGHCPPELRELLDLLR